MKLAIVTNILTPYRIPLFDQLSQHVKELTILLMAEREENREWNLATPSFRTELIPGFHYQPSGHEVSLHWNYGVIAKLKRLNPDLVLSGGFAPANLQALLYCRLFGKKYVTWGELTLADDSQLSFFRLGIRRFVARLSDGAVASSTEARNTIIRYGMNSQRVLTSVMPIDVLSLHRQTLDFSSSPAYQKAKDQYPSPLLLSVGRITERKGYKELFSIFKKVRQQIPTASLLVVGDGPDRSQWEKYVADQNIPNVHFTGFVQPNNLAFYLAIADLFVFTTLFDPFGAVLLEAMSAELPVVASIHAGATADLVDEGITGFRIDPMNINKSAEMVLKILNWSSDQRTLIGKQAFHRAKQIDVRPTALAMVKFFHHILMKHHSENFSHETHSCR